MKIALPFIATFLALSAAPLFAQQEQPPGDKYVSREEYEKLKTRWMS